MRTADGDRPLPGRDAELECLRHVWRRARRGRRQVVLLSGEPGVGKTALASRLAAEARSDGGAVLFGRTEERPTGHYQPLAGALRHAVGSAPTAFLDGGRGLGFLLPELGKAPPPAAPFFGQPGADREEAFDAVGDLVAELARPAPLVLVLDDLHWADRSTALLLDRVVEATRRSSVLVVASYCDTAVDRVHPLATLLDALAGADDVTAVRLQGLGPDVVAAMVPDADVAEALAAHGEGNPLYLGELLREMRHTGRLGEDGAVDRDVPFDADLLPRSTEDLLHRRISRLRPATRRLLAVASVVGRPFDLELVAATEEVRTERLRASAADGVAAALLEPAGAGDGRYRFPHSVTRRAAYRRLAPNTRVRLHRRVGEALERSSTEGDDACRLAEMAAHFCAASPVGRSDVAAGYAAAAGDAAMAVLAYETAADLYGRALALLDCSAPSSWSARCHLLLSLAEAQRQALEPVRARQALLEAATGAEAHDDARLLARVRDALETVGPVAGDAVAAALPRAATSGRSA